MLTSRGAYFIVGLIKVCRLRRAVVDQYQCELCLQEVRVREWTALVAHPEIGPSGRTPWAGEAVDRRRTARCDVDVGRAVPAVRQVKW